MKVQSVKKYRAPRYPDKKMAMDDPAILRAMPERWKGNGYVAVALSSVLMFNFAACGQKGFQGTSGNLKSASYETKEGAVAPIFLHGEGRGSFGCMSVAPPSFLSEEEAFQVISEEAARMGIVFGKSDAEIKDADIPETKYYLRNKEDGMAIDSSKPGSLQLDGFDGTKKIGFEFVSKEDYSEWQVVGGGNSSVDDYDFLSTAQVLKKGIEGKTGESTVGIFYNPMTKPDIVEMDKAMLEGNWSEAEEIVKNAAKEDLRNQVKDFLEWLKAEDII